MFLLFTVLFTNNEDLKMQICKFQPTKKIQESLL